MDHDLPSFEPPSAADADPDAPPLEDGAAWPAPVGVPAGRGRRTAAVVAGVFGLLTAWGVVAMAVNAESAPDSSGGSSGYSTSGYSSNDSSSDGYSSGGSGSTSKVPLGPIGSASCRSAVAEAKSAIPGAVSDAQDAVDDLIAEHPELAAYAAEAKRMIADSAPQARQYLDDAGRQLGC